MGAPVLHFLHQREIEGFKSIQKDRGVCLELDTCRIISDLQDQLALR